MNFFFKKNPLSSSLQNSRHISSLLSFVFFFSGFAGLIYQVVWQRLLTLYYGVGEISSALIVSVYMFGLGCGALLGGVLAERIKDKITFYFIIEILIGCFGVLSIPFLDFLGRHTAGSDYWLSFAYMFLFLSLPTFLMGMTLPLLTKIFNSFVRDFFKTVSHLYFINTIGAAFGALCASYVIISFFGLDTAIYVAVTINGILALLIFLARSMPVRAAELPQAHDDQGSDFLFGKMAYLLVFITGFLAIGYEIIWFRVIKIPLKASAYTFSTVLAVYLLGIALGSLWMNRHLNKHKSADKRSLFFLLQFFIALFVMVVFIGYFYLTKNTHFRWATTISFAHDLHPFLPTIAAFQESLLRPVTFFWFLYSLIDVFLWPIVFVLVPTILMGASFPLISLLGLSEKNKEGKTIGTIYFFNTIGNLLGGLVTGFLLLAYLGTEQTLIIFCCIGILLGFWIKTSANWQMRLAQKSGLLILLTILFIFFPKKTQLYELMHPLSANTSAVLIEEDVGAVVVTAQQGKYIANYINGSSEGGYPSHMFFYEAMEAASFAPRMDNILVIGYGTGSITEAIRKSIEAKKITVVEIHRALIRNLIKIPFFDRMLSDPRIHLVIDDGRRFLLRTDEKYDLILINLIRTTTAYSNNVYSQEFLQLIKDRLAPGGVLLLWMNEYRVVLGTLFSVFDHIKIYGSFCLASNAPFNKNERRYQQILSAFPLEYREDIQSVVNTKYMKPIDYKHARVELLLKSYPINRDLKPVCEYYLGLQAYNRFFIDKNNEEEN
ncbi:MAG: fused MFS/spermidine synthase [Candidatus Omnitrophota bacterium]